MGDFVKPILFIVAITIFIVGLAFNLFFLLTKTECAAIHQETGKVTKYSWWAGCMVKANDEYVPLKNWRVYD